MSRAACPVCRGGCWVQGGNGFPILSVSDGRLTVDNGNPSPKAWGEAHEVTCPACNGRGTLERVGASSRKRPSPQPWYV